MKGTRFKTLLRSCAGSLWREVRIAVTPVPHPEKWVFLVGCYNSGTTLLSEIMSHHPKISALPTEGQFLSDELVKDYAIGLSRMWVDREDLFRLTEEEDGPDIIRIKKEWGMRLDLSRPVLLEKTPPNTARMRWLQKHFDNSYFVAIVRNGYAVAEGISRKAKPKHMKNGWPIEKCAYQWKRSNEILLHDSKHLKNFKLITYEDLTGNPTETLNTIYRFLEIDQIDEFNKNRQFAIHERNEPLRNMNKSSFDSLSEEDLKKIQNIAGDLLTYFDYYPPFNS